MPIKFIYFDLADTLIEKYNLALSIQKILAENNVFADEYTIRQIHYLNREKYIFPDRPDDEFYMYFNKKFLGHFGINTNEASIRLYDACKYIKWSVFDDVKCLNSITIPCGIISNWDNSLNEKIEHLLPYKFVSVFGSKSTGFAKPDLNFFKLAVNAIHIPPTEIMYVGDSIVLDMEPAKKLGMRAILIDRFDVNKNYCGEVISDLGKLIDLI